MNEAVSAEGALANATRLLQGAELETDLRKMERLEKLADSWINIASLLHHMSQALPVHPGRPAA